ncbi:MAG: AAA family ATPase [Candidatus Binatia bacterium]
MDEAASQRAVIRALADAAFYSHRPTHVEHVQTHISHVFLAGPYVFKLKKAVRFPFLDFSTLAQRLHFCREELRLNRRLSPAVYLDVVPITRRTDGSLELDGTGEAIDYVLQMRRLPSDRLLPSLLARDAVTPAMMTALAHRLAAFHAEAPTGAEVDRHASPEAVRTRWSDTIGILEPFAGTVVPRELHAILADFGPRFIAQHEALLRQRQVEQRIREGHGDLHAEHVCFVDAAAPASVDGSDALPTGIYVFDCLEFSMPLRCTDVVAEIAFLTMDLEMRGHRQLGAHFADAYAAAAGDPRVPTLLPFYASARACVRAEVECLTSRAPDLDDALRTAAAERAVRYAELAVRCAWRAQGPMVIACMGLSGTGKSTLAAGIALALDATVVRTDVLRKRSSVERGALQSDAVAYTAEARAKVYTTLASETDALLGAGRTVIADATFLRRRDRDRLREVAHRRGVPCVFVESVADPEQVRQRLDARTIDDVSDARWDTYVAQQDEAEPLDPREPTLRLRTDGATADVQMTALLRLWQWRASCDAPHV